MKRFLSFFIIFFVAVSMVPAGAETFKIASIFSRTGDAAATNWHQIKVIELKVEEINRMGGVLGYEIELMSYDNESSALGSVRSAKQAITDGVVAVIGASWSSHSLAMAPVFQEAGIPMLTPSSTNPAVTEVGNYIFRVCFIDSFQGEVAARFAREDLAVETAVVLTNTGSRYSLDLAETFIDVFISYGGRILWEGDYLEPVTVDTYLERVKELEPDLIFIPGYPRDSAPFIKSFRKEGIDAYTMGGDGWSQDEMYRYSGKSLDGAYYISHWYSGISEPVSRDFNSGMRDLINESSINAGMALANDAVMLLVHAVETAKSIDPEEIRDALAGIRDFRGVTGRISMEESGNPEKDAYVLVFKGGRTEFVKKVSP